HFFRAAAREGRRKGLQSPNKPRKGNSMHQRFKLFRVLLTVLALGFTAHASLAEDAPEYGPAKGTLVIVGGGRTDGTGIMEKFIQLAGGPDANFVVVPTAGGNKTRTGDIAVYHEETVLAWWKKHGVKNVHMLHTHDPKVADTEAFASVL